MGIKRLGDGSAKYLTTQVSAREITTKPMIPKDARIGGRPWARLRLKVFERDGYTCCSCHRMTLDPECDHILPRAAGGTNDMSNLQTLCKTPCHAEKTATEQGLKGSKNQSNRWGVGQNFD